MIDSFVDPANPRHDIRQISDHSKLEEFLLTWELHHKLDPGQLVYGGRNAVVKVSYIYHGGDVLYELEGVPGIWHEQLLESV